ncbi:MAG: excinuclease ABC subunit UvrC [Planctomycetes bacterium]|nr:excinuclease ABC subunit UvrC [Planctomycetota bacterium]
MTREELLRKALDLPEAPGVYVMKDAAGSDIYVGKAKILPRRVSSYFRPGPKPTKTAALVENIVDFDFAVVGSELEAFLLESRLIKDLQPKYNMMLKYNELYPYIEVTWDEEFPRVCVTRRKEHEKSRYFGPFVGVGDLRACLNQLQRLFQFRLCSKALTEAGIAKRRERGCLNYHIGRCAGACRGGISKDEYRRRVAGLCRFLSGQKKDLIADLQRELETAAKELRFEAAAQLRDLIAGLTNLNQYPVFDESLAPPAPVLDADKGVKTLQAVLGVDFLPRAIEGFDIANLQGKETVGSLVNFVDGQPFKEGYRRFRIKTVEGQNDFACLQEVIARRYGGELSEKMPMPDVVLIDGGQGQLNAVAETFSGLGVAPKALLSLAKKEELVFRQGRDEPYRLARRNPALRLLQYVRDEAHRFAQHYHHILRDKSLFGEED